MKKLLLGIGSVLLLAFSIGAFFTLEKLSAAPVSQDKTNLRFVWWGNSRRNDSYIKAIRRFEQEYPQYQVQYEYYTWDDYWTNLSVILASGEEPDVIQMDYMYLAQLAKDGYLASLDNLVASGKIDTKAINEEIIGTGKVDGQLYGISATVNALATIANDRLVSANQQWGQQTFDDWTRTIAKVHQEYGVYGYIDNNDISVSLQYYLRTKGEEIIGYQAGKPQLAFTKENFIEFFNSMMRLAKEQALVPTDYLSAMKSMDENYLTTGEAAFQQNWVQTYDWYQIAASRNGQELAIHMPYDAMKTKALVYHPSIMYSISAKSTEQEGAALLIDFLTNNQGVVKDYLGLERGLPANEQVQKGLTKTLKGNDQAIANYMEKIKPYLGKIAPAPPKGYLQVNNDLNALYQQAILGQLTAEECYQSYYASFEKNVLINYK